MSFGFVRFRAGLLLVVGAGAIAAAGAWSARSVRAQDACTRQQYSGVVWSEPGAGAVVSNPVPAGRTWRIRAAGVSTEYGGRAEYMLELITPEEYRIPLARAYDAMGTPALALEREVELRAGERLGARAWLRGADKPYRIAVDMAFDETCQ